MLNSCLFGEYGYMASFIYWLSLYLVYTKLKRLSYRCIFCLDNVINSLAATVAGCDTAPVIPDTVLTQDITYGFVEYRANPGLYFMDQSTLKRVYCPCDSVWPPYINDQLQTGEHNNIICHTCIHSSYAVLNNIFTL